MYYQINPGSDGELSRQKVKDIQIDPRKVQVWIPERVTEKYDTMTDVNGAWWIPEREGHIIPRIIVAAHTSVGDNSGENETLKSIIKHLVLDNIRRDIIKFVKYCIHCMETKSG